RPNPQLRRLRALRATKYEMMMNNIGFGVWEERLGYCSWTGGSSSLLAWEWPFLACGRVFDLATPSWRQRPCLVAKEA
ncbi:MAG TPA: hypothetical protein VHS80_05735, partial [Chthoniobacterales bacterium]|nr:hypothetical protein [Chthoniobacterales bacterium]